MSFENNVISPRTDSDSENVQLNICFLNDLDHITTIKDNDSDLVVDRKSLVRTKVVLVVRTYWCCCS